MPTTKTAQTKTTATRKTKTLTDRVLAIVKRRSKGATRDEVVTAMKGVNAASVSSALRRLESRGTIYRNGTRFTRTGREVSVYFHWV